VLNNEQLNSKPCVLAYSGGLDTSAIIPWLLDQGFEVHCLLVDVGQQDDFAASCEKALMLGATTAIVSDQRQALLQDIVPYVIGLNAKYESVYRLGTALARPLIAAAQVERAYELGGATLVHGATGKGNDQVRFEHAYRSLAPELPVLAPWKVWNFKGRRDLADYLISKGYTVDELSIEKTYSMDDNLWHLSIEGGPLEKPDAELDVNAIMGAADSRFKNVAQYAPSQLPTKVEIEFNQGVPVALNGEAVSLGQIVADLNTTYQDTPWAWDLVIENRFTGIKSRGIYVNPAAVLLQLAADNLARATLNQPAYLQYADFGNQYANLLYQGEYYSDQRLVTEAAAAPLLARLTGTVTVQLLPTPYVAKIDAPETLFKEDLATFEDSAFSHADAQGFISLTWQSRLARPFKSKPQNKVIHECALAPDAVVASGV